MYSPLFSHCLVEAKCGICEDRIQSSLATIILIVKLEMWFKPFRTITWSQGFSHLPSHRWASSTASYVSRGPWSHKSRVFCCNSFSLCFSCQFSHIMSPYMTERILPQKWKPSKSDTKWCDNKELNMCVWFRFINVGILSMPLWKKNITKQVGRRARWMRTWGRGMKGKFI